jgi:hypothetical protein
MAYCRSEKKEKKLRIKIQEYEKRKKTHLKENNLMRMGNYYFETNM